MQRPIKFRCWDKLSKKIYPVNVIDFDDALGWNVRIDINNYRSFEDSALMQFTGLLDKNGKEIYEGDLITWPKDADGVWSDQAGKIQEVKWPFIGLGNADLGEVIGNIYESPDLLKEGKD